MARERGAVDGRRGLRRGIWLVAVAAYAGLAAWSWTAPVATRALADEAAAAEAPPFRVDVVTEGLEIPWDLAFLPDGRALLTERAGRRLNLLDPETGERTVVGGLPEMDAEGDGGLHDVLPHPDFGRSGVLYLSYSVRDGSGATTVVDRARLEGSRLVSRQRLFEAAPRYAEASHFGGRMVLSGGYLFVTVGDRQNRDHAQDLGTHNGKVIRLHEDGRVPADNPFAGRAGARPEIWSYGHRNPQGLALHPQTGALWLHEHGPRGGDEVNIVERGRNYGWPLVTDGEEYAGGPVGDGLTSLPGMEQALHYYVPSIAPSGMAFYTGDAFPGWRGDLFIGALALRHLNRLVIRDGAVVREERLLDDRNWRVRFVEQGPDGFLYLGVDDGLVVRLRPT